MMEYSELGRTQRPMAAGRARGSSSAVRGSLDSSASWTTSVSSSPSKTPARIDVALPLTNHQPLITNHGPRRTNHEPLITNHAVLPERGERIESPLSYRKQTIGVMSSRNWNEGVSRVTFSTSRALENYA